MLPASPSGRLGSSAAMQELAIVTPQPPPGGGDRHDTGDVLDIWSWR